MLGDTPLATRPRRSIGLTERGTLRVETTSPVREPSFPGTSALPPLGNVRTGQEKRDRDDTAKAQAVEDETSRPRSERMDPRQSLEEWEEPSPHMTREIAAPCALSPARRESVGNLGGGWRGRTT